MRNAGRSRNSQRGQAALETAMVVIPLMMMLIGTFELCRAIFLQQSLTIAVKRAARYAVVHGETCIKLNSTCLISVGDVASVVAANSTGLDRTHLRLTLSVEENDVVCTPLTACESNGAQWPPTPLNATGQLVTISGSYQFQSIIPGLWGDWEFLSSTTEMVVF